MEANENHDVFLENGENNKLTNIVWCERASMIS